MRGGDGWRGGRWAVRSDENREAGYPAPVRPFRRRLKRYWWQPSLARPSGGSCPRRSARTVRPWGPRGASASAGCELAGLRCARGWRVNSPRSSPLPGAASRPHSVVYIHAHMYFPTGLKDAKQANTQSQKQTNKTHDAVSGPELLVVVRFFS